MKLVKRKINIIAILVLVFALVLASAIFSLTAQSANAYNSSSVIPSSIGSITLLDYATSQSKRVFDGNILKKLYSSILNEPSATYEDLLDTVNNSTSLITGVTNDSAKNDNSQPNSMNFDQIANLSGQEAITLEFGGFTWNVVYLTTNTNSGANGGKAGDLIATLWMSEVDNSVGNVKWRDFVSTSTADSNLYASNVYSTSKMRVDILNGGGDGGAEYATGLNAAKSPTGDRANHHYSAFTMSNTTAVGDKSLTRFLATPSQVNYQIAENFVWSAAGTNSQVYLAVNEAWGDGIDGVTGPDVELKHSSGSGGWYTGTATDTNDTRQVIRKDHYYDWKDDYLWLPSITETGYFNSNADKNVSLWGIANGSNILKSSKSVWLRTGSYLAGTLWYLTASGGETYDNTNSASIGVRPALHLNLSAAEENSLQVDDPTDVSVEYNGTKWLMEIGTDNSSPTRPYWYDSDKLTLTYPSSDMIDVGEYEVTATIKDEYKTKGYHFDGTPGTGESDTVRKFKFIINPKKITPTLSIDSATSRPKAELAPGTIYSRDTGDKVPTFGFTYQKNGGATYNDWPANDPGTYTITPRITNSATCKNYVLATPLPSLSHNIKKSVTFNKDTDSLVWQATETGGTASVINGGKLTYSPKGYTISIGPNVLSGGSLQDKGVKVSDIKIDGAATTNVKSVKTYNIVATLVNYDSTYDNVSITVNCTLEIEKAKYDLSNTVWDFDQSKFVYNQQPHELLLKGIPTGLTPKYKNNRFTDVGASDYSAEIVEFTNADTTNYVTPVKGQTDTYIGSFNWTYSWNIDPQEISTANWSTKNYDFSGTVGQIPVLTGYDSVLDYKFFTDDGTPIELSAITIDPGQEVFYKVQAVLKDPNNRNYTVGTQSNPKSFSLGKSKTAITVTVSGSGQTFDNTPKEATFTTSTLSPDAFAITYFDASGNTLSGAPTHAGNYKVQITLVSDSNNWSDNYYIQNGDPVDFIINKATVDLSAVKWNYDSANPFQYQREGGQTKNHKVELVGWDDSNPLHAYIKNAIVYGGDLEAGNVGSRYTATYNYDALNLDDFDNFAISADKTLNWSIVKRKITRPAYTGENLIFSNEEVDLFELFGITDDYAEYYKITATYNSAPLDGFKAKDAGVYTFTCDFLPEVAGGGGNVSWEDNSNFKVNVSVTVDPRTVVIKGWDDSAIPMPIVDDPIDLDFLVNTFMDTNGAEVTYQQVMDTYNTTFRVKAESKYGDNVIVREEDGVLDYAEFSTPADPNVPATPVAKPTITNDTLKYTGEAVTFEMSGFDDSIMIMVGSLTVTDAGDYNITVRFRDGVNYCWDDGSRAPITLTIHLVDDPNLPNPDKDKDGESNPFIDFFKKLIEQNFPLWQIATTAAGALLSLIFMIKAIQYGNRKKKANGETKKLNAKTYAALLPVFDTTVVLAGLSNKIWSIIAFAMVGVTALLFIIAIITRKGWKKAELAKEQAIEDSERRKTEAQEAKQLAFQEKFASSAQQQSVDNSALENLRREMEERHRQEMEAMKIMLANMMGRAQADNGMMGDYASIDDTDLLAEKVFAKLLPAVQQMIPEPTAYLAAPDSANGDDYAAMTTALQQQNAQIEEQNAQIAELQNQIADLSQGRVDAELLPDQSEEIRNLTAQIEMMQNKMDMMSSMSVDELDDGDFDDEEEWDSILDEDEDDDFVEAVVIEEDGTVRKSYPNFRMRLKQSSDKNREWYAVIKNLFCSQKGVTYRVYKRVEKIRYQGQVIAVIGIAKRSIKLWLALKPYEYDARRYHHKDVSDKPRFVDVPMYVRITSDRALDRSQELILALFQELNMEARKRYTDRPIQELIFTLKHNRLLTNKQNKQLLCEVMHVHDCDVLDDETAEKCIEFKNVESLDESNIETVKLDDIDAKFQDGNRITLDRLKKVGLVSEDCTGYTVTADKRLTKPLIIVANDFTLTAVKLITLTGGRAIRLQTV